MQLFHQSQILLVKLILIPYQAHLRCIGDTIFLNVAPNVFLRKIHRERGKIKCSNVTFASVPTFYTETQRKSWCTLKVWKCFLDVTCHLSFTKRRLILIGHSLGTDIWWKFHIQRFAWAAPYYSFFFREWIGIHIKEFFSAVIQPKGE